MNRLIPLFALCLSSVAGAQTTYYVDDDHPSDPFPGFSGLGLPFSNPNEDGSAAAPFDDIQKAIDAAVNGDTVLVEPSNHFGYYTLSTTFGSLDFKGKAITVKSTGGAAVTAIDGSQLVGEPGLRFVTGEGPDSVLEGFTIQFCDSGSAGSDQGGGIYVFSSSPTLRDCVFVANHAYAGGAVYLANSSALIEDCRFESNTVAHQGGAIYTTNSSPVVSRCHFEGNSAAFGGAFLSRTVFGKTVTVSDCAFIGNVSGDYAGALAKFDFGQIVVERSRFLSNVAQKHGGGIHIQNGATIRDCTLNTNTSASDWGGGISMENSTGNTFPTTVTGCTITNNTGGGLYEFPSVTYGLVTNSICWDNAPFELTSSFSVDYSSVLGGYAFSGAGDGVLDVDPLFRDPWGDDGVRGTLDDNLSLLPQSGCIDAGDTTLLPTGTPLDLARNFRAVDRAKSTNVGVSLLGLTVDLGAYEFQSKPDCNRVVNLQSFP